MTNHRNDERTVRCPVDGCEAEQLARGIHLHVRQSAGGGHGPQGEIPDHITMDDLDTVGEQEVEMDYPADRDTDHVARLCPYCSTPFQGHKGVLIHLSKVAGRKNHPADAADRHDESDFPRVEVNEHRNITSVAGESAASRGDAIGEGAVPRRRVYRLIAELLAEDQTRTASRVRRHLLGTDDAVAPGREEPPHPALFEALLTQGRADVTDHAVTAALESEGLMIACRGESAFLSTDEARDIAARLEQVATTEDWHTGEVADLIAFLRGGAAVLDGKRTERSLHEEFNNWR